MRSNTISWPSNLFVPGEVLALLTPIEDLEPGLYLLDTVNEAWATVRWVIDEEKSARILVSNRRASVPVSNLDLFTPLGLQINSPS